MTKAILVAQFLRARAWWRLDSAGASAPHVARSVVALLDAAAYLRDVPDDDPDLLALAAAGCFASGVFDPGPEGADIIRSWQLADEPMTGSRGPRKLLADPCDLLAGPRELLAELVRARPSGRGGHGGHGIQPGHGRHQHSPAGRRRHPGSV